jgi:hypothetical protein
MLSQRVLHVNKDDCKTGANRRSGSSIGTEQVLLLMSLPHGLSEKRDVGVY